MYSPILLIIKLKYFCTKIILGEKMRENSSFISNYDVQDWASCFHALMMKSYEKKLRFAKSLNDLMLKSLMIAIAMEHRKIAEVVKTLYHIEKEVDIYSKECKERIGSSILDNIREAITTLQDILGKREKSNEDMKKLILALRRLHDINRGVLSVLSEFSDPIRSKILAFLAEDFASYYDLVEKYLIEVLRKSG